MIPELLATEATDDVGESHRSAQHVRERDEYLVTVPWPKTSLTRLKSSMSSMSGDRVVRARRAGQLGAKALVEVAMVVEARERVGLERKELERLANLGVVESEGRRIPEALRKLELLLGEACILAEAVDV